MSSSVCQTSAELDLAAAARELARICEKLLDLAALARSLSAQTDWQSKAATAYHDRAEAWSGDVARLSELAETARWSAARSRDRAAAASMFERGCW